MINKLKFIVVFGNHLMWRKIEKMQHPNENDNKHIKTWKLHEILTFGCQNQNLKLQKVSKF